MGNTLHLPNHSSINTCIPYHKQIITLIELEHIVNPIHDKKTHCIEYGKQEFPLLIIFFTTYMLQPLDGTLEKLHVHLNNLGGSHEYIKTRVRNLYAKSNGHQSPIELNPTHYKKFL